MARDKIFALRRDQVGQFQFDESVAEVFPDMISRSVPGYASILSVIEQLAARFVLPGSHVYDLGCSLGAATLLIRNQSAKDCVIHAIDSSPAMTSRLQKQLAGQDDEGCRVEVQTADICDVEMANASMIVLNFTLQFVDQPQRQLLINRIYDALVPGGALLISEKICFDDPGQQKLLNELHLDFKRACGYSELEISQKRTSLENTLIPESLDVHQQRLASAGFETIAPWFQCFNFASILAIKGPVDAADTNP